MLFVRGPTKMFRACPSKYQGLFTTHRYGIFINEILCKCHLE